MASRWCPRCGAEYVEGTEVCADDGAPLVDAPTTAKTLPVARRPAGGDRGGRAGSRPGGARPPGTVLAPGRPTRQRGPIASTARVELPAGMSTSQVSLLVAELNTHGYRVEVAGRALLVDARHERAVATYVGRAAVSADATESPWWDGFLVAVGDIADGEIDTITVPAFHRAHHDLLGEARLEDYTERAWGRVVGYAEAVGWHLRRGHWERAAASAAALQAAWGRRR